MRLDRAEGRVELSARVDALPAAMPSYRVWIRFPAELESAICVDGSPFFAALLPTAARLGVPLRVDAEVDARLLGAYPQILEIWNRWYGLARVEADASAVGSHRHPGGRVASFFSGGVDSFYTVLENRREEAGEHRITELLFVHGFDVPLENVDRFSRIARHVETVSEALGVRLWKPSSNIGRFTGSWAELQHGASLAGVGLALGRTLRRVYIPASHTYAHPIPWGTHPLVDPLWSTTSTRFVHAGCEAGRLQKLIRIADSDVALQHLRVCNETRDGYNCSRCQKCLRTMIGLTIAGVLDRCPTFEKPLDLDRLRGLAFKNESSALLMEENLVELRRRGVEPEIQEALEQLLHRWRYRRTLARLSRPLARLPRHSAHERRLGRRLARAAAASGVAPGAPPAGEE